MNRAVLVLLATGCATPLSALTLHRDLSTEVGPVSIRSLPGAGIGEPERVEKAIALASPKVHKWGTLPRSAIVYLLPSHADLESAVRRYGYEWLRAWAQFDNVILQTPSTWAVADADIAELLAHELTHCLMYQRSGTSSDWAKKSIPLWFREGMATWTAEQGYRWMTFEDLAAVYEEGPHHDPVADAEAMYQKRSGAVYAAAHYAFTFLVKRYGTEGVDRVLAFMQQGKQFDDAFEAAIGITHASFVAEFRRFIVWRGFRGSGRPVSR